MSKPGRIWGSLLLFVAAVSMISLWLDTAESLTYFADGNIAYKVSYLTLFCPLVAIAAGVFCAVGIRAAALGLAIAALVLNLVSTMSSALGDKLEYPDEFSVGWSLKYYFLGQGHNADDLPAFQPGVAAYGLVAPLLLVAAVGVIAVCVPRAFGAAGIANPPAV